MCMLQLIPYCVALLVDYQLFYRLNQFISDVTLGHSHSAQFSAIHWVSSRAWLLLVRSGVTALRVSVPCVMSHQHVAPLPLYCVSIICNAIATNLYLLYRAVARPSCSFGTGIYQVLRFCNYFIIPVPVLYA